MLEKDTEIFYIFYFFLVLSDLRHKSRKNPNPWIFIGLG